MKKNIWQVIQEHMQTTGLTLEEVKIGAKLDNRKVDRIQRNINVTVGDRNLKRLAAVFGVTVEEFTQDLDMRTHLDRVLDHFMNNPVDMSEVVYGR